MKTTVIYLRASTSKQMNSLEVQRRLCESYAAANHLEVIEVIEEVVSGGSFQRPEFDRAVQLVEDTGSVLLAAKVDRLSRRISVIGDLIDRGIAIRVVQLGNTEVNKVVLAVFAALGEAERDFIKTRTKEALAHLKASGQKLGGPNLSKAREASMAERSRRADKFVNDLAPVIEDIKAAGTTTQSGIASALNRLGYTTRRGGLFSQVAVGRIQRRLGEI